MGLRELVRVILLLILLLGTDTEPQGASLFNQDSIVELINRASPEGRCLPGNDSTLQNASASSSRAPGLLAELGKGRDLIEHSEVAWDLPCPLSSFLLWTHPHCCACFKYSREDADFLPSFSVWSTEGKVDSWAGSKGRWPPS